MEYNEFEKHIQKTFAGDQADIDTNQLLINLNLPVDKSRNIIHMLYWLIPLAFTLGVITSFFVIKFLNTKENPVETTVIPTASVSIENGTAILASNIESPSTIIDNNKSTSQQLTVNQAQNTIEKKILQQPKVIFNTKPTNSKTNNYKPTDNLVKQASATIFSEPKQVVTQNVTPIINSTSNTITPATKQKTIKLRADNSSIGKALQESRRSQNHQASSLLEKAPINPSEMTIANRLNKVIECPNFDKRKMSFAAGFEVGYGMPIKTLYSKSVPNDLYYDRLHNEQTLEAMDLLAYGLIGLKKKPIMAKIGVNVFRISERLNFESTTTTQDTTWGIISSTVSTSGDTVSYIYGDIISETTTYYKSKVHYNINQVNLPISLLYNKSLGKTSFQFEGGVNFNLRTWTSGLLLAEHQNFVSLDGLRYFRKQTGISYFGRINFVQKIGTRNDFYLSPQFLFNPNDWTTNSNDIGQKYQNWSIKAGYLYRFQ